LCDRDQRHKLLSPTPQSAAASAVVNSSGKMWAVSCRSVIVVVLIVSLFA
jgi:hypothetical protein